MKSSEPQRHLTSTSHFTTTSVVCVTTNSTTLAVFRNTLTQHTESDLSELIFLRKLLGSAAFGSNCFTQVIARNPQ